MSKKTGERGSLILVSLIHGLGFILLGLFRFQSILLLIILIYLSRVYKDVIIDYYINGCTQSNKRATVLSVNNLVANAASAVYVLVGGALLNVFSVSIVLIGMGIIVLVLSLGYVLIKYPLKIKPC